MNLIPSSLLIRNAVREALILLLGTSKLRDCRREFCLLVGILTRRSTKCKRWESKSLL